MPALPEKTVRHVAQSATPAPTDPMTRYGAMKFVDDSARIGWLAYHTKLGTREIREIVGCKYNLVVAVRATRRLKEAKTGFRVALPCYPALPGLTRPNPGHKE